MNLFILLCTYFLYLHDFSDVSDEDLISEQIENVEEASSPITSDEDAAQIKKKIVVNHNSLGVEPASIYYDYPSNSDTIILRNKISRFHPYPKYHVYISTDRGRKFERILFEHTDHTYDPSICSVTEHSLGCYSDEANIIFYAFGLPSKFKIIQTPPNVVGFYFHGTLFTSAMILVKTNDLLYLYSTDYKENSLKQLFRTVSKGFYHGWLDTLQDTFMTVEWNETYQQVNVVHVKLDKPSIILSNCISSKFDKNIYSASCMNNGKLTLYISKNGIDFKLCRFPNKLNITKFRSIYMVDEMIFASVTTSTSETNLYSAHDDMSRNQNQIFFRRILTNVYVNKNDCESLYIHPVLLGMMIVATENKFSHRFTSHLISYNFGNNWNNIKSLTIVFRGKDYPCIESCLFNFYDCEFVTEHHQPKYAPWLILKYGYFHHSELNKRRSLFVSRDAGLSWRAEVHGDSVFTYLDHGSIILLSRILTTEIQFSVDECRTWIFFQVSKSVIRVFIILEEDDENTMEVILFASAQGSMFIYHLDFSKIFTKPCTSLDYDTWMLMTSSGNCFLGETHTFKYRKSNNLCETDTNIIKNFESAKCKCSDSDFGCAFGFYFSNGKCLPDPDHVPEFNEHLHNNCTPGELINVKVSRTHMVKMGHCLIDSTKVVVHSEKELCNPIEKENMLVIYGPNKITIFNIAEGGKYTKSPGLLVSLTEFISEYILDFHTKTFYSVKEEQIYFYNYGFSDFLKFKWQKFGHNIKAKQIQYDFDGQNLFVLDTTGKIYAINVITFMSIEIWSQSNVEDFKLYPHAGLMLIRIKNKSLYLSKMDGKKSEMVEGLGVMSYTLSARENLVLYTVYEAKKIYSIDFESLFSMKKEQAKVIVNLARYAENIEVVGSNLVVVEFKSIFVYNLITKTNYTKETEFLNIEKLTSYNPALMGYKHCQHLECHGICIDAYDRASCYCMEGYVVHADSCVCKDGHCNSHCRTTEKQCNDGQCLNKAFWCDGISHCLDGSDEKFCQFMECQDDEFKCASGNCISKHLKCDGKKDCADGTDEKCDTTITNLCRGDEFDCQDNICIKKSLVCNDVIDCQNGVDEEDCKKTTCLLSEFKCFGGECINSSFVCNNESDCEEGEDENEKICGCSHFCFDGSCLNETNICDSKKDCPNGEDETNCRRERITSSYWWVLIIFSLAIGSIFFTPLGKRIILRFKLILNNVDLLAINQHIRTRKTQSDEEEELLFEEF